MRTLAVFGLCMAGCAITLPSFKSAETRNGHVPATECKKRARDLDDVADAILVRICEDPLAPRYAKAAVAVAERHRNVDDRKPDEIAVALLVIDASRAESNVMTGLGAFYANAFLERTRLTEKVASLAISPEAKAAFVDAAFEAKRTLDAKATGLDARRRALYVDGPRSVFDARARYRKEHEAAYRELDRLETTATSARAARQAPDELVRALDELRATYLGRCKADSCRFDPLVIEVTRELVLLHVAAGDALRARAENSLLLEPAAGRHLFPVEIGAALYRSTAEEKRAYEEYEGAKRAGMDPATLAARFGSPPPIHIDAQDGLSTSSDLPDLSAILLDASRLRQVNGIVRAVTTTSQRNEHGELLVSVSFRDVVTESDITECHQTGKVVGVSFDSGRHASLEYENACTVVGTHVNVEKVPSVLLPANEARHIRPGEHLAALALENAQGVVVRSTAKGTPPSGSTKPASTPVLQVRGARIGR